MADLLLILALIGFFYEKYKEKNFAKVVAEFVGFTVSIIIALIFYVPIADFVFHILPLSRGLIHVLIFWGIMACADLLVQRVVLSRHELLKKTQVEAWEKYAIPVIIGFESVIFLSVIVTLVLALPVDAKMKDRIADGKLTGFLADQSTQLEFAFRKSIGMVADESLNFLTTQPLKAKAPGQKVTGMTSEKNPVAVVSELKPDPAGEAQMLKLVNNVRVKHGLPELTLRSELVPIARDYAVRMWREKFFGHVSPEGLDAGDRLTKAKVKYHLVGENLALSSTVTTAHIGLINSQEHLDNILDSEFKQVGIGIVENGAAGIIVVQIFTD